jgi:uncharacterized protein (TIGR02246 family)
MNATILKLSLIALLNPILLTHAQENALSADAVAKAQADAYIDAWEKKDAKLLTSLYSPDASYSIDTGDRFQGHSEIEERLTSYFSSNPDATLSLSTQSARFLTPDVVLETGVSTVVSGSSSEVTNYGATHVKKGGKWLIAAVHEEVVSSTEPATQALASLEWMIGKWRFGDSPDSPTTEASWTLEGKFISRTTKTPKEDGNTFVTVEVIGYDPTNDQLRSWIYDNEGGFGECTWRQDGDKWLVNIKATLPDGRQASSQHVISLIDDTRVALDNLNRVIDGEVLPNHDRIEISRIADEAPPEKDK